MKIRKNNFLHICKSHIGLLLILLTTFILQVFYAATRSLWLDEFFSWAIIKRPLKEILFLEKDFARWYMNSFPPLYEVIVRFFLKLVPICNDLILRLPSIISFLITIVLIYALTVKISRKREAGLLASFLVAFNSAYFSYGYMLRGYLFLTGLCVVSLYLIYMFLTSKRKIKYLVILSLVNSCLVYTSYISFIIIIIEGIFLHAHALKNKDNRILPYVLGSFLLPFVIFIPWAHNFGVDCFIESVSSANGTVYDRFLNLFTGSNRIFLVHMILFPISYLYCYKKSRSPVRSFFLLLIILFFIYLFLGVFFIDPFNVRYFLPILFILILFNCIFIAAQKKYLQLILISFLILATLADIGNYDFHIDIDNHLVDIKSVAHYLRARDYTTENTVIFFEDIMVMPGFFYYFLSPKEAYLATAPWYGTFMKINEYLVGKNIIVWGNCLGTNYYADDLIVADDHDILILVDTGYFRHYTNIFSDIEGKENFIMSFEKLASGRGVPYQLLEKKEFNGFVVAIYKKGQGQKRVSIRRYVMQVRNNVGE